MINTPGHLEKILRYASLAPNPHNCQPWAVNVLSSKDLEFVIQSDSSRWLPRTETSTLRISFLVAPDFRRNSPANVSDADRASRMCSDDIYSSRNCSDSFWAC